MRYGYAPILFLLVGCGGPSAPAIVPEPAPVTEAVEQPEEDPEEALIEAVYSSVPPTPPANPDKQAGTEYVEGALKAWYMDAEQKLGAASSMLVERMEAEEGAERIDELLSLAKLHLHVADQMVRNAEASMPLEWARDPNIATAYVRALVHVMAPKYSRARDSLELCLGYAQKYSVTSSEVDECQALLTEKQARFSLVEQITAPPPQSVAFELADETSVHLGDCRFKGVRRGMQIEVFADAGGSHPLGFLEAAKFEEFVLARGSERHRAKLSWPLVGEVYLQKRAVLHTTLEIPWVKNHLWYPAGAPVDVVQGQKPGTAKMDANLRRPGLVPAVDTGIVAPCSSLTLDDTSTRDWEPTAGIKRMRRESLLYREPGKDEIGFVGGTFQGVEVLEESGKWLKVRSELNPHIMFEGWMAKDVVDAPPASLSEVEVVKATATHETSQETPLYYERHKTRANVAQAVPVVVLGEDGELAHVAIAGMGSRAPGSFFLEKAALRPRAPEATGEASP